MTRPVCMLWPLPGYSAVFLLILIAAALFPSDSCAQTTSTWTDGTGNWSNPLNWDNGVPNGNYNAVINSSSTSWTITLDTSASINGYMLLGTKPVLGTDILNIASGNTLSIQGGFDMYGSTLQINSGSSLITGGFGNLYGQVNLNDGGTLAISAPSGSFVNEHFGNFAMNSTGSVTSIQLNGQNTTFYDPYNTYITMSDNPNNLITGVTGTETWEPYYSIKGAGSITNLGLVLLGNGGSIWATGQNPLIITPNSQGVTIRTTAGLGAASGSTLIVNGLVNNQGGDKAVRRSDLSQMRLPV